LQRSIIAPAERVTNLRWGIALVVALGELVFQLGEGAGAIGAGAALTVAIVVAVAAVPLGIVVDRFGLRPVALGACTLWALAAALHAVLGPASASIVAVMGGIAAAALVPCEFVAIARWFPRSESLAAWAIVAAASFAGATLGILAGCPAAVVAGLAAVAALLYAFVYREPREGVAGVTHAERTYLERGDAQPPDLPAMPPVGAAIRTPMVWIVAFGFGSLGYALAFNFEILDHAATSPLFATSALIAAWIVTTLGWTAATRHAPRGASGTVGGALVLASTLGILLAASSGVDVAGAAIASAIAIALFALAMRQRA
jgi:MFS family permease